MVLSFVCGACDESMPDAPRPEQMVPGSGSSDEATSVAIVGGGFSPLVKVSYDDKERSGVSTAFRAYLGDRALEQVRFQDPSRLTAQVPPGLSPGSHDLTVVDPRGHRGVLEDAFVVQAVTIDGGPPDVARDLQHDGTVDVGSDSAAARMVTTVAGSGQAGFKDDVAGAALFFNPRGVAVRGGRVYVADYANHRVRVIDGGKVTTLAGSGIQGHSDGSAATASFDFPAAVAVDAAGTVYVADSANDVIRMIKNGVVSTFAGDGTKGFADGPAASARFRFPQGIAEENGTVYVADTENHRVRMIKNGVVSTLAGDGTKGFVDGPVVSARFSGPVGLAISGITIFVADPGNHRVRAIAGGQVTTVAGTGSPGAVDGSALSVASFIGPTDVAADGATLFIADRGNHRIRIFSQGIVLTVTGSFLGFKDGPLSGAQFYSPTGVALDGEQIYVADQSNHRIRAIDR